MTDTALIVSSLVPILWTLFVALLVWGWKQISKKLDGNTEMTKQHKEETLAALGSMRVSMESHQADDVSQFNQLRERTAWLEGNASRPLGSTEGKP